VCPRAPLPHVTTPALEEHVCSGTVQIPCLVEEARVLLSIVSSLLVKEERAILMDAVTRSVLEEGK
jgi:hypothetical protein